MGRNTEADLLDMGQVLLRQQLEWDLKRVFYPADMAKLTTQQLLDVYLQSRPDIDLSLVETDSKTPKQDDGGFLTHRKRVTHTRT